jgi:hypothetical protein
MEKPIKTGGDPQKRVAVDTLKLPGNKLTANDFHLDPTGKLTVSNHDVAQLISQSLSKHTNAATEVEVSVTVKF